MIYTEYYKCNVCGAAWCHEWDTDDYNNDYTECPKSDGKIDEGFDYEEITQAQFELAKVAV